MFWYILVLVTENKQNYITSLALLLACCNVSLEFYFIFLILYFFSACTCCSLLICKTSSISWATEGLREKERVLLLMMYHCHSVLRAINYYENVTSTLLTLLELISMEATEKAEYKVSKKLSGIKVWNKHNVFILSFSTSEYIIKKLFVSVVTGMA